MINTVNLVYEQLLKENEFRERSHRHYPSGACANIDGQFVGKCRRATWCEWHNNIEKTNPIDAPALFKMQVGDLIHNHLDNIMDRALLDKGFEQVPDEDVGNEKAFIWQCSFLKYPFSGRKDKRFKYQDKIYTAEWKSTYGRGTDYIKKDGPKIENLLQCAIYLEQDIYPINDIILMYAARDTGYLFGYFISKEDSGFRLEHMNSSKVEIVKFNFNWIIDAIKMLEEYLDGDVPPPKDYQMNKDWQCNYCSYQKWCDNY